MNPNQPKPTQALEEFCERIKEAIKRVNAITEHDLWVDALLYEADTLGITPSVFRKLVIADQPPN